MFKLIREFDIIENSILDKFIFEDLFKNSENYNFKWGNDQICVLLLINEDIFLGIINNKT